MKGKRFTEAQIITVLKEHEASAKVPDLVRKYNVSEQRIYRWRAKYGGMEISEAKCLRELERENNRLKRLLAEAMLDNAALTELVGKNGNDRCPSQRCQTSGGGEPSQCAAGVSICWLITVGTVVSTTS